MTDAELWAAWRLWMGVAAVVVVIASALLVTIWITARRILAEAHRALAAAESIQKNTQSIWALETTNDVAERIAASVEAIQKKGGALAAALDGATVGRHAK
jgi:sensor histidine kinase regulating citrate/malate metabolism